MAERELTVGGRRLSQLKVDELKAELEKRGLKKSGNKGILIERLQEALDKELEMNECYEGFSVPPPSQLKAATLQAANSMITQSGSRGLQPTEVQQPVMVNQHQISSLEHRKAWLQPELPQPQMVHHQTQQEQQPRIPDQQPSQFNSGVLTQSSYPQSDLQQPVAPEARSSSSSSDGEQKGDERSSTSSERDQDSDEQQHDSDRNHERVTSPLNQSTAYLTERNSSLLPDKEKGHLSEDAESEVNRASNAEQESQSEHGGEKRKEEYLHLEEEDKENSRVSNQPSSLMEDNTFEVEPSEEDKAVVDEPKAPLAPKPTSPVVTKKRKISIPRTSLPSTPNSDGQPASRKRRWGSSSSSKKKTSLSISTDSLKVLIPGVQLHSTPALEAVMDLGEDDNDEDNEEEEKKAEAKEQEETPQKHGHVQVTEKDQGRRKRDRIVKVEEKKTFKLQRKMLFVESAAEEQKTEVVEEPVLEVTGNPHTRQTSLSGKETSPAPADRSPSPARNPKSKALHVKNLVRPFTLNQLKELLGKHGSLTDNGFWIDKIKSHCYMVYKSVEDAAASRQALHGVKWPLTSPKILSVDFADEDEMARDTEGALGKTKEKGKEIKPEEVIKKKEARLVEEEDDDQKNPGNLLDNLFRKTKTTPCLYWLPLSDEEIATREKEREERRKQRQDERKKEEEDRKERQQQREREREKEKEKRERETDKQRSRSPRDRRPRERSRSRSRGPRRR